MEIWGDKVHGINPDERAIAGVLKRVFNGRRNPGIRFYSSTVEHFLQQQNFIVIDERGDQSLHLLNKYDSYLLGDQVGFPTQVNHYFSNQPKFSLGNSTYLSSQVITILNYLLDTIKPDE
jgi:tRNA pseudouridine-54 N-methylase